MLTLTSSDEGRAMMQLIHDIAPGAKLLFYTAFESPVDFAQGIITLADNGADIIVDDISWLKMPMFQDGPIAQAVNEVKARGVSYFSAAGNAARFSYAQNFERGQTEARDFAHDFGRAAGGESDFYQRIIIPKGSTFRVILQWDDQAEIANSIEGAKTDLDLFLLDADHRRIITSSQDSNIGHDPVEFIGLSFEDSNSESTEFNLKISHHAGPAPTNLKYVVIASSPPWA